MFSSMSSLTKAVLLCQVWKIGNFVTPTVWVWVSRVNSWKAMASTYTVQLAQSTLILMFRLARLHPIDLVYYMAVWGNSNLADTDSQPERQTEVDFMFSGIKWNYKCLSSHSAEDLDIFSLCDADMLKRPPFWNDAAAPIYSIKLLLKENCNDHWLSNATADGANSWTRSKTGQKKLQ